ncbi:hypothetical protein [Reichenbachiella sp. 5M10]|uniref:hypothetical protein n=1 Tax=Reichenbachiella sp. 5M10 TaxID=1889772 RepID=UPI00117AD2A6|nr:hypothetical protein [Reichenbachiella sp. 5M10]
MIKIYIGITLLLLIDLTLYLTMSISFPGRLLDQGVFWVWFLGTIYLIISQFKFRWAKRYAFFLFALTILGLFPMGIPVLSTISFALTNEPSIQVNSDYRVFKTVKSVIGMPYISITQNFWVFEKEVGSTEFHFELSDEYLEIEDVTQVNLLESTNNQMLRFEFVFEDGKIIRNVQKGT